MYSKFAEDKDMIMTGRWTKDIDGIIFFVRPEADLMYWWGLINKLNRLVYSL